MLRPRRLGHGLDSPGHREPSGAHDGAAVPERAADHLGGPAQPGQLGPHTGQEPRDRRRCCRPARSGRGPVPRSPRRRAGPRRRRAGRRRRGPWRVPPSASANSRSAVRGHGPSASCQASAARRSRERAPMCSSRPSWRGSRSVVPRVGQPGHLTGGAVRAAQHLAADDDAETDADADPQIAEGVPAPGGALVQLGEGGAVDVVLEVDGHARAAARRPGRRRRGRPWRSAGRTAAPSRPGW